MDDALGNSSSDEPAGARRLLVFMAVDEHMDREVCLDRRQRVADTPAWRQAALRASGGTGANDTSSHKTIPQEALYDRAMIVPAGHVQGGHISEKGNV
jgi:hypothetical protein